MPRKNEKLTFIYAFFLLLVGCCPKSTEIIEEIPPIVAPAPPPKIVKPFRVNNNFLVVLDAGHGGEDFGAHSNSKPQYHEKNLNLTLAKMVRVFLNQQGFRTEMTREDDRFVTLEGRAKYANEHKAALFVSLHFNSAPSKEADGIEVYYYKKTQDLARVQNSHQLASTILAKVVEMTDAKVRGAKHGDFAVIRLTNMPAVLVEGGFLTNDDEMNKIKDPGYLKRMAWGVAQGIKEYAKGI